MSAIYLNAICIQLLLTLELWDNLNIQFEYCASRSPLWFYMEKITMYCYDLPGISVDLCYIYVGKVYVIFEADRKSWSCEVVDFSHSQKFLCPDQNIWMFSDQFLINGFCFFVFALDLQW